MPKAEIICPKCGSSTVTKKQNQEYHCDQCGKTFYYVTPSTHNETNPQRYDL